MRNFRLHPESLTWFFLMIGLMALTAIAQTTDNNYITYHGNLARTGWNAGEKQLTHELIDNRTRPGRFGKLWEFQFPHGTPQPPAGDQEQAYAAPLYYQGVVYAATERNWVYALDAATGKPLWERMLDLPLTQDRFEAKLRGGCGDINPWHGITGTPALDPKTGTLYVVNLTLDANEVQVYKMYALDINAGGATPSGWPDRGVVLSGTYRNQPFDAYRHTQRGALTLFNGWVYVTFSARCDNFDWKGWVIGVQADDPSAMRAYSTAPDGNGAGIWGGAGISIDDDGYMYVVTGNGTFNQSQNPYSFAQSVLRLDPADPDFFVRDPANFYTVPNVGPTNNRDEDIGGSSVLVIPDQSDTPTDTPQMLLTSGKDGVVYLINRDNLGGHSSPNGTQIQRLKIYPGDGSGGAKVAAAYFDAGDQGRFIYLAAGRNAAFIGNYAHWGDANVGMSGARAALGTGPVLAVYNNRLFAAWVANDDTRGLWIKSSADGRNWSEAPAPINATVGVRSSPALAVFDDRLAAAWVDGQTRTVMVKFAESEDGRTWPMTGIPVGVQAAPLTSPSLTVFGNRLYVSWIADTPDRDIMIKSSSNGTDWSSAAIPVNETSDHNGGVAPIRVFNNSLYVAWVKVAEVGNPPPHRLFYKSSPDGADWTAEAVSTGEIVNPDSQIALAVFNDLNGQERLHFFWLARGPSDRQVKNRSLGTDLVTGRFEIERFATNCNETGFGGSGVHAVAFNGNLHMAFVGNGPNRDLITKIAQPAFPGRSLVALKLVVDNGKSKLVPAWAMENPFTYNPGPPYVTSDGRSNPIVWVADPSVVGNPPKPIVRGFHAITGEELYNSERRPDQFDRPSWEGHKFGAAVAVDGKLFLATEGVTAYGIFPE